MVNKMEKKGSEVSSIGEKSNDTKSEDDSADRSTPETRSLRTASPSSSRTPSTFSDNCTSSNASGLDDDDDDDFKEGEEVTTLSPFD